jgi:uncharacterized membrane protein YcaP (DUF421 family)
VISFLGEQMQTLLGLGADVADVNALQMALRTMLVYPITLLLVRFGSKRFMSEATAFDVIVAIMLGSVLSRAINGSAPFVPTLLAGAVLLALHWLLAFIAYRTDWFGSLVKGQPVLLIEYGEVQQDGMRRGSITWNDLRQALRLRANQIDLTNIRLAYLERNGQISFVPRGGEPRVVEMSVKDDVQTVRVELD